MEKETTPPTMKSFEEEFDEKFVVMEHYMGGLSTGKKFAGQPKAEDIKSFFHTKLQEVLEYLSIGERDPDEDENHQWNEGYTDGLKHAQNIIRKTFGL